MIFGVAKAIAREHDAVASQQGKALILDLQDVPILSTTIALALENMILDARQAGIPVYINAATGDTRQRLERLGQTIPEGLAFSETRFDALKAALGNVNEQTD